MTFPTGTVISTANLDSGDDDPSLARVDLYNMAVAVNAIIASANASQGVLILDGSGKILGNLLPATFFTNAGNITLQPASGVVSLQKVLRLSQIVTADLGTATGTTSPVAGDMAYLTDGDAGQACLAVYDGTKWRVVRLMTQAGDVGAALTSAFTLTATAVA
jgi:hypothetical protein